MKLKKKFKPRKNEQVRVREVRLIDEKREQLGIFPVWKALQIAKEKDLDLVEVSPNAKPPVCRLLDYGKFLYSQQKEEHKSRGKKILVKQVRISPRIGPHDIEFKTKQIEKFVKKGHRVEVEIFLRGREKAHMDLARKKLEDFIALTKDFAEKEEEIKKAPRGFMTVLIPKKDAKNA